MSERHFGTARRRSSGRWQARHRHEGRVHHHAPQTFETKSDALAFRSVTEAEIPRGAWIDPRAGRISLRDACLLARPTFSSWLRDARPAPISLFWTPF